MSIATCTHLHYIVIDSFIIYSVQSISFISYMHPLVLATKSFIIYSVQVLCVSNCVSYRGFHYLHQGSIRYIHPPVLATKSFIKYQVVYRVTAKKGLV